MKQEDSCLSVTIINPHKPIHSFLWNNALSFPLFCTYKMCLVLSHRFHFATSEMKALVPTLVPTVRSFFSCISQYSLVTTSLSVFQFRKPALKPSLKMT